ncbi:hypothetical protein, partial [Bellilinea caldifistulae]
MNYERFTPHRSQTNKRNAHGGHRQTFPREIVEKQTTGIDEKGKTLIQSNQTTLEISGMEKQRFEETGKGS